MSDNLLRLAVIVGRTWHHFEGGRLKDPDGPAIAAKKLLWWARILRDAKTTHPYSA